MADHLFAGTAEYYSRYRPRYPQELLSELLDATEAGRGGRGRRMVDWGCGTGELTLPLSARFDEVVAIDQDPDMVALAREKAERRRVDNVRWVVGRAEDFELEAGGCELITAGSSFHWMDRGLLARRARAALAERGVIALVGGGSEVWEERAPWHTAAVRVLREFLGERRRAGSGLYRQTGKHGDFLEPAGFVLETHEYLVEHVWSADTILGYLYSTSFARPDLFGTRLAEFEARLRAELADLSPIDAFPDTLDFHLTVGHV